MRHHFIVHQTFKLLEASTHYQHISQKTQNEIFGGTTKDPKGRRPVRTERFSFHNTERYITFPCRHSVSLHWVGVGYRSDDGGYD
jgi:hypothetical protein